MVDSEFKWKQDKWADIGDLIQRWAKRYPQEMQENLAYVREVKAELNDPKYAELGVVAKGKVRRQGGMRLGLAINPNLMSYIETFYPEFMKSNEDVREFGKRFPAFRIPEKN